MGRDEQRTGIQLAVKGESPLDRSVWLYVAGVLVAVAVMTEVPLVAVALLAFSLRFVAWEGRKGGVALGAGAVAVALLALLALDPLRFAAALMPTAVAVCIVVAMRQRRATVLAVSLAVVAGSLLGFVVDQAYAAQIGTTARELLANAFDLTAQQMLSASIEGGLLANQMAELFNVMWPYIYVTQATAYAALAGLGSFFLEARVTGRRIKSLALFDAPMWAVGAVAAALLCVAASFALPQAGSQLMTAGVTLLLSVRAIFALQGLGVVYSLVVKRGFGPLFRAFVLVVLFWIEMTLMIVSVIGLVDVWANFRRLPRGGSPERSAPDTQ